MSEKITKLSNKKITKKIDEYFENKYPCEKFAAYLRNGEIFLNINPFYKNEKETLKKFKKASEIYVDYLKINDEIAVSKSGYDILLEFGKKYIKKEAKQILLEIFHNFKLSEIDREENDPVKCELQKYLSIIEEKNTDVESLEEQCDIYKNHIKKLEEEIKYLSAMYDNLDMENKKMKYISRNMAKYIKLTKKNSKAQSVANLFKEEYPSENESDIEENQDDEEIKARIEAEAKEAKKNLLKLMKNCDKHKLGINSKKYLLRSGEGFFLKDSNKKHYYWKLVSILPKIDDINILSYGYGFSSYEEISEEVRLSGHYIIKGKNLTPEYILFMEMNLTFHGEKTLLFIIENFSPIDESKMDNLLKTLANS